MIDDREALRRDMTVAFMGESDFVRDSVAFETLERCMDAAIIVVVRRMAEVAREYAAVTRDEFVAQGPIYVLARMRALPDAILAYAAEQREG